MSNSDYRRMIDRGRRAGLNTSQIYQALASCRPTQNDRPTQQADSNGFILHVSPSGGSEFSQSPAKS